MKEKRKPKDVLPLRRRYLGLTAASYDGERKDKEERGKKIETEKNLFRHIVLSRL